MSARGSIAVVAGALLVLAAWFLFGGDRRRPSPPRDPGPAEAAGETPVATDQVPEEHSIAAVPRRPALLREPELELRGVVVTTNGDPVAGAKLTVTEPLLRQFPGLLEPDEGVERTISQGRSGTDGSFRFRLEPDGTYDLVAEAKGFALARMPDLYAGEEVRVVLHRTAAIFGRITDAVDGSPIPEAVVEAEPYPPHVAGTGTFRASTDPYGTYRLDAVPPEIFDLKVEARDHARVWNGSVAVEEGEEYRADFALPRGATVRGRVTDGETKSPIEGASVVLWGETTRRAAVTDAEGRYVLRGVPVSIREGFGAFLRFRAPGYGEFAYRTHPVPEGGLEQDVFLLAGRRARGRVVGSDRRPVQGARVLASASRATQGDRRSARTDEDGRFELSDLRIDLRHTLFVLAEGHATGVFDFPEGEWERPEIELGEIRLEPPGTIAGTLRDAEGRPIEDAWISLKGDSRRRDSLGPSRAENEGYQVLGSFGFGDARARTDERGRYAFTGLPAGSYRLTGGSSGCANLAHEAIDLPEGGRILGADLALDLGLLIEGVVVDKGGTPVRGAVVRASREDNRGPSASTTCGRNGTFTLSGLEPGEHVVRIQGSFRTILRPEGEPRRFAAVTTGGIAAGTGGLRLVLPEAAAISGVVVGPDGKPVASARVSYLPGLGGALPSEAGTDREGRFLVWSREGSSGNLVVNPTRWRDTFGRWDRTFDFTLENVAAGTKDLLVRLPKVP